MPMPITVPVRSRMGASAGSETVAIASSAAAIARWMKRSMERTSRLGMWFSASKPLHSPAISTRIARGVEERDLGDAALAGLDGAPRCRLR